MKSKKTLRIAVLVFALTFAVGAAFAATNGMLAFGGTVRINSAVVNPDPVMQLDFIGASAIITPDFRPYITASSEIITGSDGHRQMLTFDINVLDLQALMPTPGVPSTTIPARISFGIRNTGEVPTRIRQVIPQQQGPLPLHLSVFTGRVLEPDQIISGTVNLCVVCLNNYINRNDISITDPYTSLTFSFVMFYEAAEDSAAGLSGDLGDIVIEPAVCEEI